jgi:hypothetical protein
MRVSRLQMRRLLCKTTGPIYSHNFIRDRFPAIGIGASPGIWLKAILLLSEQENF